MSLRTLDIAVSDLASHADLLHQIYRREIDLAIVRGAFSSERLAVAAKQLESRPSSFDWTPQEHSDPGVAQMTLAGESLTPYVDHPRGPDIDHYLTVAAQFRTACRELLGDFEGELEAILGQLSGGRPVSIPRYADGRYYHPATIRWLPPGCRIPLHAGNFFIRTPGYAHLSTLIALEDQLSYFVPIALPERGGELLVYLLEWDDPATPRAANGMWDENAIVATSECEAFSPGTGDLLLFDGGRYFHRVTRVEGARHRFTIGGFIGFSKDLSQTYYWS